MIENHVKMQKWIIHEKRPSQLIKSSQNTVEENPNRNRW